LKQSGLALVQTTEAFKLNISSKTFGFLKDAKVTIIYQKCFLIDGKQWQLIVHAVKVAQDRHRRR